MAWPLPLLRYYRNCRQTIHESFYSVTSKSLTFLILTGYGWQSTCHFSFDVLILSKPMLYTALQLHKCLQLKLRKPYYMQPHTFLISLNEVLLVTLTIPLYGSGFHSQLLWCTAGRSSGSTWLSNQSLSQLVLKSRTFL